MKSFKLILVLALGFYLTSCDKVDKPLPIAGAKYDISLYPGNYQEDYVYPIFDNNTNTNRNVLLEDFTGHQCGNCKKYGHGIIECQDQVKKNKLRDFSSEVLPKNIRCMFGGCKYNKLHKTEAHHCLTCNKRFHSSATCPLNIPSSNNFQVKCPLCKKENIISS
jgi:uncharacterized CHY-type Zn-finger protein